MSHHRLGEAARARVYFDWAVRWTRTQPNLDATHVEELTAIHAEAEELLKKVSGAKSKESQKK